MSGWEKDWDNPQDAVYDKIRSSVITTKEMFEASIRTDERDRIIKSLQEDAESQTEYCKPLDSEHCHTCFEAVRLIALIKGENK